MSESKRALGSDLAKVDAHEIQPEEYEDIPELTDEWFAAADLRQGGKLIKKGGRPKSSNPKQSVNLRLDAEVLAHFRQMGPGWQSRINEALRKASGL